MTDEEIWEGICKVAAKEAGISIDQAKAILKDADLHAHNHTGISPACEVVLAAVRAPLGIRVPRPARS